MNNATFSTITHVKFYYKLDFISWSTVARFQ